MKIKNFHDFVDQCEDLNDICKLPHKKIVRKCKKLGGELRIRKFKDENKDFSGRSKKSINDHRSVCTSVSI